MEAVVDDVAVAAVDCRFVGFEICNANALSAEHTTNKETSSFIEGFLFTRRSDKRNLHGESLEWIAVKILIPDFYIT